MGAATGVTVTGKDTFAGAACGAIDDCCILDTDVGTAKDGNAGDCEVALEPDGTNALAEAFRDGAVGNAGFGAGAKVGLGEKADIAAGGAEASVECTRPRGSSFIRGGGEGAVTWLSLPSMIS